MILLKMMIVLSKNKIAEKLNTLGSNNDEFLFITNFQCDKSYIYKKDEIPKDILFDIDGYKNFTNIKNNKKLYIKKKIINKEFYEKLFQYVIKQIKKGNTYLLNLTLQNEIYIKNNPLLKDIFLHCKAKFKLSFKDKFVCFSPERFIKIQNNTISTYPIKGTIDASIENAKQKLMDNKKEYAEHTMVVDLLRNDLSIVGKNTKVKKFRKIKKINAGDKELLQTYSEIQSNISSDWKKNIGNILTQILPAGSISGTPKKSSLEIINEVETQQNGYKRDFFCGICGYFDGESLDSFVLIRFIQKNENGEYFYKSGGGITLDSNCDDEFNEMIQKIYIPS